jgi:hypothetical protein
VQDGLGHCDAQCANDIKFIKDKANSAGQKRQSNDENAGDGSCCSCCSCCAETDISRRTRRRACEDVFSDPDEDDDDLWETEE